MPILEVQLVLVILDLVEEEDGLPVVVADLDLDMENPIQKLLMAVVLVDLMLEVEMETLPQRRWMVDLIVVVAVEAALASLELDGMMLPVLAVPALLSSHILLDK